MGENGAQLDLMESGHAKTEQLEQIRQSFDEYQELSKSVVEWSQRITPLWQRSVPLASPVKVETLCDYTDPNVVLRRTDICSFEKNLNIKNWVIEAPDGKKSTIPSTVFRILPPDGKLISFLDELHSKFKQLRVLWFEKQRNTEFNVVFSILETIRSWDDEKV